MIRSVTIAAAFLLPACFLPAQQIKTGVVATGDPLVVVDDIKTWETTSKEKVGETTYTDADGHTIGHADTYQDRTTTHSAKIWYGTQGPERLADEDFFRIANDQAALDQTLAMRADGKKWNNRGKWTMVGGAVGAIVGFFVPNAPVKLILTLGGTAALSGGWYMAHYGAAEMDPENHAVDRSIADRAARAYDAQLGHTVGVNLGKKF